MALSHTMKGFETLVNGRKKKFLPVTAKVMANFQIHWVVTELASDYIYVTGMKMRQDGRTKNPVLWQSEHIKPGDEITVRVVSRRPSRSAAKRVRR